MIAIAGGKGGCGKTTTTACLARALADAGRRPVVVDADLDLPDLHVVCGAARDPGVDALADGASLAAATQSPVELPGVRLVAGGGAARDALADALHRLDPLREPVLVDTAAGASPVVADPLRVADATVLVSAPTEASLTDAAKTAAMARTLGAPPLGVVLTRAEPDMDPGPLLECPVLARVPSAAKPLVDDRVRAAYAEAAERVSERKV